MSRLDPKTHHTTRDISYAQVGTCDVLNGDMAGGWTLTPHHHYDLGGQTLFLGNGSVVKATPVKTPACVFSNIQISATGTLSIVSRDGAELYLFDADGRHLRTYDTLLGAVEYAFGYDANGHLVSIVDKFSNTTSVQRAGSGEATNIVSPFGVRTQLLMDDNGYLSAVVNPANETNAFRYSANGLLTNVITRKGYVFNFVYDEWGRLREVAEYNAANTLTSLVRYAWNGFLPWAELNSSNGVNRTFSWGVDLSGTIGGAGGIGGLVGMRSYAAPVTNYYVRQDGKGNVTEVRRQNGTVAASYGYSPFGALLYQTNTYNQPFRFQTKLHHARSGYSSFGYRWYDCQTGGWLSSAQKGSVLSIDRLASVVTTSCHAAQTSS